MTGWCRFDIIYAMIKRALQIAYEAHEGQVDKQGRPYILHPIAVMESLRKAGKPDAVLVTALLHDTVEDTDLTKEDIAVEFGIEIAQAVDALSRREGEGYQDYVARAVENPIARFVKMADLEHNLDSSRGPIKDSLRKRYEKAKLIVKEKL